MTNSNNGQAPNVAEVAEEKLVTGMNDMAALVGDAVGVLAAGMKSKDPAHAYKCATALLSYVSRLESFKQGRFALHFTAQDALSHW